MDFKDATTEEVIGLQSNKTCLFLLGKIFGRQLTYVLQWMATTQKKNCPKITMFYQSCMF